MSKIIVAIIFMGMGIIACGCEKKVDLEDDTMLTLRRMIKNSSSTSKLAPVEKALQLYENGVVDTKPLLLRAFVRFERGKFSLITYDEDRNLAGFEIIEKDISGDVVLKEKYPVLINDSFDYEVVILTWPAKQRQTGDVADTDKIEEFLKTGRPG